MTTYGPRAEWPGGGLFKEVKIAEEVLLVVTLIGEVGIAGICTIGSLDREVASLGIGRAIGSYYTCVIGIL